MPTEPRGAALIAGGGIGGFAAALALARIGWPSIVAERRSEWSEAGAGIQLSPNGVHALRHIGVAERLEPFVAQPREIVVRDAVTARVLQRLPLGEWIEARHGAPYWQVHRGDLQAALLAAVAAEPLVTVVQGFEAVLFEAHGDQIALRSQDGRELQGAFLVAADGVFSQLRRQLFHTPLPRFTGRTAARTVVVSARPADSEPLLRPDATGVWLARGAHIVHYPVRRGSDVAIVVVRTAGRGSQGWSEPIMAAELETALAQVAPAFAQAVGSGHPWRRWALFQTETLSRWSSGRVTLLGDAAHPTLPFLAQGGVLALEDAVTLAACLSHAAGPAGVPAALAAYEAARRGRSKQVVAAARRNGHIFHLGGPAALARNAAMRVIPGERVMAGFDWVYGWRPPAFRAGAPSPGSLRSPTSPQGEG